MGIREDAALLNRLVHLRAQMGQQQMDFICMYQTAISHVSGDKQLDLIRQRKKLWTGFDNLLAGLPFRSSIVVLGDFNTHAERSSRSCWPRHFAGPLGILASSGAR